MKRLSIIAILFAIAMFGMRGEMVAVETGIYQGDAIACTSTDPHIGANFILLKEKGANDTTSHTFFNPGYYDAAYVEQTLGLMDSWDMKYVRVFDGQILSAENTFITGVQANISDFLTRAANHGLTVFFTFTTVPQWMFTRYTQITGLNWKWDETQYNTEVGRQLYGDRIKYIVQQCFASRSQDMVISVMNSGTFPIAGSNPWAASMTETQRRQLVRDWINYMCAKIRQVDTRTNHKIAAGIRGRNALVFPSAQNLWTWPPSDLWLSNLDILDMHFYHFDSTKTWTEEFDYAAWWIQYCPKPVIIGELGAWAALDNDKEAAQNILSIIHRIRTDSRYDNITDALIWTMTPYYKTEMWVDGTGKGIPDGPFHPLTDGYTGFSRLATTLWYDNYTEATFATNYSTYSGYPASNLNDCDESTHCIIQHVPSTASPNEYIINFNQWYRIHSIQIVDTGAHFPSDFDVYVYHSGWQLFGSYSGTDPDVERVDIVCSAPGGWMSAPKIKIVVTGEFNQWSSLSEVYVNPITIVTK